MEMSESIYEGVVEPYYEELLEYIITLRITVFK